MATKNFTQFDLRTPLLTSDYIVGYKEDGSAEYKATVKQIVDLVQDSNAQTLSFNEANKNLTISSGNTVSLSALVDSSIDTGVRALTGNWQSTYLTVSALSASWEESAEIIPTVTTYLSTNNVIISGLTVTDNLSTSVHITDLTATKTFLSSDTSRIFHFDTTTQPLCAIFPSTLPDGFNVAVMNTGTNNLRLSAAQLNSVGVVIGVQYGGAFVYKDNSQLFAVGRL